ncbi:hypothetical protein SAY87_005037 [Trapa incisa]|uniref:CRAL-TRIO domain-containing protein n=1 Tax=Trapa incisa TaxID=236973 RepID=A0AAN7JQ85_9MYRT|nr:hypothetical protein SAY87_005037 [Trapa incisa]
MYIINANPIFKEMLLPAAQKFLDAKTITKIHVLEPKSLNRLLEVVDPSQLPDFFGGSCTCSAKGGCFRSNKGPWADSNIMKLVRNSEATSARQVTSISNEQEKGNFYVHMPPLKERVTDASDAESGSDIDDCDSPTGQQSSSLNPSHEEGRVSDSDAFFSCRNTFSPVKTSNCDLGCYTQVHSLNSKGRTDLPWSDEETLEEMSVYHWFGIMKSGIELRSLRHFAKALLSLAVRLVSYIPCARSLFSRKQSIHQSNVVEAITVISSPKPLEAISKDYILPCLERLQRLDKILEELSSKPSSIPLEKDKMLLDSLDRIRSLEHDLDKTKKVVHAASTKQLEIAEHMERWSHARCRRRRSCLNP